MENDQPNVLQAVPFFMVADMEASLRFYTKGLGFEIKNTWTPRGQIEWCWLQLGKASLMLQQHSPDKYRGAIKGAGISVCFTCRDAIKLYHEFNERGVAATEPFVGNGLWVTCVNDPDGYKLDFNSETEVPEETKYSDWLKTG